jgi:hypothetical protein
MSHGSTSGIPKGNRAARSTTLPRSAAWGQTQPRAPKAHVFARDREDLNGPPVPKRQMESLEHEKMSACH